MGSTQSSTVSGLLASDHEKADNNHYRHGENAEGYENKAYPPTKFEIISQTHNRIVPQIG